MFFQPLLQEISILILAVTGERMELICNGKFSPLEKKL
jgi:hypothetical protein